MLKKIVILGSNGMLGQMVKSFFNKEGYEILTYNKRFDESSIDKYFDEINSFESSIVINCIGRIKQKSDTAYDLLLSNTIFPLELSRSLKSDHLLIHPSTDCVFDGISELPYLVKDKHTANDIYGISKSLGEKSLMSRSNTLILRVSIIGPDINSSKGLLSWFLNVDSNAELHGYTNHFWNGITTLEWCEKLLHILRDQKLLNTLLDRKIIQLGTDEIYSKYQMLVLFNKIFHKNFIIAPFQSSTSVNRCLNAEIISMALEEQLIRLNNYMVDNF
jgi:dTDP-4-dehydrorhamnose reductase